MFLKQGDLAPKLRVDTNADVTGATAVVLLRQFHTDSVVEKELTISGDPLDGILEYQWADGDTDVPGTYEVEAVVTFAGGEIQTFPQRSDLELIILPKVLPPAPPP